jgi:hypothetical protein
MGWIAGDNHAQTASCDVACSGACSAQSVKILDESMRVVGRYRFVIAMVVAIGLAFLGSMLVSRDAPVAPQLTQKSLDAEPVVFNESQIPVDSPPTTQAATATSSNSGVLRGRVIDAESSTPVAEFKIEVYSQFASERGPGARVFRASDGRFEWPNVPARRWNLSANAAGYQRFELNSIAIQRGETTPEIVLPLRRGATLKGRVYDALTGTGIEAADVSFREAQFSEFHGNWRRRPVVTTDRSGSFVLDGVPFGRVAVVARSKEHASRELIVTVGPENASLQIALSAGSTIAGRLTAADGVTPIAGRVQLSDLDRGTGIAGKITNDGEFSFTHLPPGRYRLAGSADDGYAERDVIVDANQRADGIVLALNSAGTVRGVVTGLSATDLKRLSISAYVDEPVATFIDAKVDGRGGYALSGVKPGRVRVAADVSMKRQLSRVIEMPGNGDLTVDFHFARGARLTGHVTRAGKPMPGVNVEPQPLVEQDMFFYGASVASNGTYAIDGLPDGEYRLIVGGFRGPVVRVSGDTVFDVELPAIADFAGRIMEEPGGIPIVSAIVEIWTADPGSKPIRLRALTDHFGRFALAGLQPGDYLVTAYKSGYELFRERVSFSSPISDRSIRLQSDPGVQIRVRDSRTDRALRRVYANETIGPLRGSTFRLDLDEEGTAFLPSDLAGSVLTFVAEGFSPVEIRSWNGQALDLQLQPRTTR